MTLAFSAKQILLELRRWKSKKGSADNHRDKMPDSKMEIREHLISEGFNPSEFMFSYLIESGIESPAGAAHMVTCAFNELPENLECFLCHAVGNRAVIYDYHRHRGPRIARRDA
jgi:hypothetical protein